MNKVIAILAFMFCAIALLSGCVSKDDYYPRTAVVVEVDCEADVVMFMDSVGICWQAYGAEDWMSGDVASLMMDGKHTNSIYDDEIISARFSGWTFDEYIYA